MKTTQPTLSPDLTRDLARLVIQELAVLGLLGRVTRIETTVFARPGSPFVDALEGWPRTFGDLLLHDVIWMIGDHEPEGLGLIAFDGAGRDLLTQLYHLGEDGRLESPDGVFR